MSAITVSAITVTSPPTTRFRLTIRGRRVLAVLVSAPIALALALAALSSGSAIATAEQGAVAGTFEMVTVVSGDTLWTLAERIAPEHDPRDVVDDIVQLNGLSGVAVFPGQELAIPTDYAPAS